MPIEQINSVNLSYKVTLETPKILGKVVLPISETRPIKDKEKSYFLTNNRCSYCNREFTETLKETIDHIVPKSRGGTNRLANKQRCCHECNQLKGNLTLTQFKTLVWVLIKILNGKYTLNINDLYNIYYGLRDV